MMRPVARGAPAAAHADRVALVVADDRLLAAPDQRDRAAQLPGGEREQVLDREVLAPAEGAADGGVAHDHLLFGQLQHRGDLAAVLVQPLPGRLDHHAPVVVDVGDAGLGLEEGVLLPGGLELALQHTSASAKRARRRRPCGWGCAAAGWCRSSSWTSGASGASAARGSVTAGRSSYSTWTSCAPASAASLRLGDDQRDLVALEAHDLAAEDRLVGVDQAVGVVRHVGGGEHGDDAGMRQRGGGIERADARVGRVRRRRP